MRCVRGCVLGLGVKAISRGGWQLRLGNTCARALGFRDWFVCEDRVLDGPASGGNGFNGRN